jgi:ribonuclease HII
MLAPYYIKHGVEVGCDEAGRGCLAGPVFAAAVVLPKDFYHPDLDDSKKLSALKRNELRTIIESQALYWAVASCSPKEIDRINILNASFKAMHKAIQKLSINPTRLLIDGNRFNSFKKVEHHCIIKGDGIYASIAAASILAKTYRDEYMLKQARKFPDYGWQTNMGYPTVQHRTAIGKIGPTKLHRNSFRWHPNV